MTRVPRWLLLAALLGFFFPFATVSCAGQEVATIHGVQLVLGADVTISDRFVSELGSTETPTIEPEPWAIAALILLGGAMLVDFLLPSRRIAVFALSGAAAFALLLLWQRISSGSGEVPGLRVSVDFGWLLALVASLSAAGWIGYELASVARGRRDEGEPPQEKRNRPPPVSLRPSRDDPASTPADARQLEPGGSSERFCPTCGTEFPEDAAFCHVCGRPRKILDANVEGKDPQNRDSLDATPELGGFYCSDCDTYTNKPMTEHRGHNVRSRK